MKPSLGVNFSGLADSAGIMASSSGSDTVAPTPLRKVRLCNDFLVTNVMEFSCCLRFEIVTPLTPRHLVRSCRGCLPHLERCALNHSPNQRSKGVIVARGLFDNGANSGPIIVLNVAADGVHHQLLGDGG